MGWTFPRFISQEHVLFSRMSKSALGPKGSFLGVKWPEQMTTPASSTEVKSECSHTSAATVYVHGVERDNLVICFVLRDSLVSVVYVPTFWNAVFHLHRRVGMKYTSSPRRKHTSFKTQQKIEIKDNLTLCLFIL
jgi:hypothetical protein